MPEHIRALIIILAISITLFAFAHKSACAITTASNFTLRRNVWIMMTLAAFLAPGFWFYLAIAALLINYANRRESTPTSLYFFILFVLPEAYFQIPGIGSISYVFDLSYARILSLLILLPAYLSLRRQSDTTSFGRTGTDKVFAAYLLLVAILFLRDDSQTKVFSLTNAMRQTFYLFIDVFLPYFVISRSLKSMQNFRDALLSLVLAIVVLAPMAIFETFKFWLLYSSVTHKLDLEGGMTGYLGRDGILRSIVTTGQPIALGYLMVVGIGFYIFLQRSIQQNFLRRLGLLLLIAGLIAPLSRGPWVGAVVLLVVFIVTGRSPARYLMGLVLATLIVFPLISALPGGERVINLLPFIGTTEKVNADYREKLLTNSLIVIQRDPWFGSNTFMETREMEEMRQGEGIIDIVNTYLSVALSTGLIGFSLFVSIFGVTLWGIYRTMRKIPDRNGEDYLLGRALLATLLAIMVIIFSVSSITVIPIVYWAVVGVGAAYPQMVRINTV